ncbi:MAG: hypothetical protein QOE70_6447 [Chthoniobacter sp.]|jgi:glycosyltransferase involved in cell wall biosynthesis|nr:hypothetical protein [Chthoniobacter sp.]
MKMVAVTHPTGNANVRAVLSGLRRAGRLSAFYTSFGVSSASPRFRALPVSVRRQLERRAYDLPPGLLKTRPVRELVRLASGRVCKPNARDVDAVYQNLDRSLAAVIAQGRLAPGTGTIYGYEDGCREAFRAARHRGLSCCYDLPIGYWRAARLIFEEEAERQPDWAMTLTGLADSPEKLARKDEELALADSILVASSFTRETLALAPAMDARISVIPYGAPVPASTLRPATRATTPLRVLFVGGLSQRKGLSYLFEAIDRLKAAATLTVIGRRPEGCPALDRNLARHTWIPTLPHAGVLEAMREHDVLVFPSLFEGFGLVILEALAQGLPVITTPHTGGPDILTEGDDGFIIPLRSTAAIEEKLAVLARDRVRLEAMRHQALRTAARHPWSRYGDRVAELIRSDQVTSTQHADATV